MEYKPSWQSTPHTVVPSIQCSPPKGFSCSPIPSPTAKILPDVMMTRSGIDLDSTSKPAENQSLHPPSKSRQVKQKTIIRTPQPSQTSSLQTVKFYLDAANQAVPGLQPKTLRGCMTREDTEDEMAEGLDDLPSWARSTGRVLHARLRRQIYP